MNRIVGMLAAAALCAPAASFAQGGGKPAAGGGKTEFTWYGHAAFVVKTPGGTVIAIDPWLSNPKDPDKQAAQKLEKVDYILVSHGHADHVGDAVAIGRRTGAKLVTSFELGNALVAAGYPKESANMQTLGNMGGAVEAGDATVIMVPAAHSSSFTDDKGVTHPAGNPLGFVIKVKGGPTIYHTGDTDVTSDMRLIPDRYGAVDVLLACIGGHFTMDPAGAALAAELVKAKTVVPMHYGTFPVLTGTPDELARAIGTKARVVQLEIGKPWTY
jgi:L-ascorbate metabolism protein UlaG (beta-lactamase superfamily)